MPNVSRIGDIAVGTCVCHSPPIPWVGICVTGANSVLTNGQPTTRIGDIFVSCHAGIVISGSGTVITEGSPTARIGDITTGCGQGTIVTGSPDTICG